MAMTFNIFTGTIDYTGASAPPASVEVVEYRTISVGEASAKQLTLAASPATAAKVKVDIISGTPQAFGSDYTVSGTVLDWTGLGLDGILASGDQLRIAYFS